MASSTPTGSSGVDMDIFAQRLKDSAGPYGETRLSNIAHFTRLQI